MVVRIVTLDVLTLSASFKVPDPIDVMKVVRHYGRSYEPELFPAVMFRKDCVHFTCFHTGSVLMTGIKSDRQLNDVCLLVLIELPLL